MSSIFVLLLLLSVIALVVGLVRPSLVRLASRKRVGLVFGGLILGSGIVIGVISPAPTKSAVSESSAAAATTTAATPAPVAAPVTGKVASAPAVSTPSPTSCAQAILISFPKVTAAYTKAYDDGKVALGTHQYTDASAGLQALMVPGSAASNFSAWHKTWTVYEPSFYDSIVKAYTTGSDCYYGSKQTEPDALANWRDDMVQLDSDITTWGTDATDWQISAKSSTVLKQDEANVNADIAMVQKDLDAFK